MCGKQKPTFSILRKQVKCFQIRRVFLLVHCLRFLCKMQLLQNLVLLRSMTCKFVYLKTAKLISFIKNTKE